MKPMYELEYIYARLVDATEIAQLHDDYSYLRQWLNELEKYVQQEKQDV